MASARDLALQVVPRPWASFARRAVEHLTCPADFSEEEVALFRRVSPFTMTSPERVLALRNAVRHVLQAELPGDFVECGVWRGGSLMVTALTLLEARTERTLWGFDTFEGMPPPSPLDRLAGGRSAAEVLAATPRQAGFNEWCIADLADVQANLASTGYRPERVRLVKGLVEDTIPAQAPEAIALLRLDTDWYQSTRHELQHLYPRLARGGVLIIDDYGHWEGARKAVDEWLAEVRPRPLLQRIDGTGRLVLKP